MTQDPNPPPEDPGSTVWQAHWNLGIEVMDAEHRALMAQLHGLAVRFAADAQERGTAREAQHRQLIAALEALGTQTRAHFDREEEFMRSIDYPDLCAHVSEHALLHAEFTALVRELRQRRVTHLELETVIALRRWLVGHLLGADQDYAEYYFRLLGGEG